MPLSDLPPFLQAAYEANGLAIDETSATEDEYIHAHAGAIDRIVSAFVDEQIQDGWHEDEDDEERDRRELTAKYGQLLRLALADAFAEGSPGHYPRIKEQCAVSVLIPDERQLQALVVVMGYLEHAGSLPLVNFATESSQHG